MKLNIGCGSDLKEGYINVDAFDDSADVKADIRKLPFNDNSIDGILAEHCIEHLHYYQIPTALREWHRVLKPGGSVCIETPDFLNSCKVFAEGDYGLQVEMYGHFFSTPWEGPGYVHYFLLTEQQLRYMLLDVGFREIDRIESRTHHANKKVAKGIPRSIYLRVNAKKP